MCVWHENTTLTNVRYPQWSQTSSYGGCYGRPLGSDPKTYDKQLVMPLIFPLPLPAGHKYQITEIKTVSFNNSSNNRKIYLKNSV